ncbi:MAG: hypothetical protein IJ685_14430, partial [Selenomonadaceae bacterium]|nr:hypothetical protein [Selenomonadaceae bacterium]
RYAQDFGDIHEVTEAILPIDDDDKKNFPRLFADVVNCHVGYKQILPEINPHDTKAKVFIGGGADEVFNYRDLYKVGKKCCNGVRWKQSVQNFELRLFSGTVVRRRAVLSGKYKFSPYVHFTLCERGKVRPIDAPRIQDRQVEKVFTQKVLLPLYLPSMIHNNGASLPNKGFHFSQRMLVRDLCRHFRKYGREGGIILADEKKFFPSANHEYIYSRHEKFITDDELKAFGDAVVKTVPGGVGMPLGVEPSQAEMIAYPSEMDNYLSAQCKLTGGHYMDDFYNLLSPATMTATDLNDTACRTRLLTHSADSTQIPTAGKKFLKTNWRKNIGVPNTKTIGCGATPFLMLRLMI